MTPAQVFHPGEYLRDELDARHLSVTDFADAIHRSVEYTNEVLDGKRHLSPIDCSRVGLVLGTSASVWEGLQASWDRWPEKRSKPSTRSNGGNGDGQR